MTEDAQPTTSHSDLHIKELLEREKSDLNTILEIIQKRENAAENINDAYEEQTTFGQRLADKIAAFGGSWNFIIAFFIILFGWMIINTVILGHSAYDPYPFILLNLILSSLAALQAPVIMMSQNRQEERDRLRAENDYKVNLKAELEIRSLHDKIDHIMIQKRNTLIEMQEMQLEILEGQQRTKA
jgi:uncharacterized membrane protein